MAVLTEDDQIVHAAGKDAGIVIRISRTAGGTRTWTVGAQLASSADAEKMLPELLAIDDTLAMLTAKPTKIGDIAEFAHYGGENGKIIGLVRKPQPTLGAQLADSLIIAALSRTKSSYSTTDLINATKMPRSSLRYHLTRLARAGVIEKQAGRGGPHTNLYRLTAADTRCPIHVRDWAFGCDGCKHARAVVESKPVTADGKPTGAHK